jgi:serine/threonine protein kinase/formylglycine-generating enzyme required for sulfatase activity
MTAPVTACPPQQVLADFGLGRLEAGSVETIGLHLETCGDCRQFVASLSGDSFVNRLREAHGHPSQACESVAISRCETPSFVAARRPTKVDANLDAPPELADHPDYELLKELGRGGMGVVYLSRNRLMDRLEVLKVVSKTLLDVPGALERFQQEIRSAAKLDHSNIVRAYSVLRPGDLLIFAMEFVEGSDLAQTVKKRGPLPVTNATFYVQQAALGLQHAHEKGMVHRDIKPNNLMLAQVGKKHIVKILDFGLAKASSEKQVDGALTKSGQMLGTPDYVAPEQTLDAQAADIRADIYSLGCTLYFLLAGKPPFTGKSLYEILRAHHSVEAMPLNELRPEIPEALAQVVAKMMAKQPADRYQTPGEAAKALGPFFKAGAAPQPLPQDSPLPPQVAPAISFGPIVPRDEPAPFAPAVEAPSLLLRRPVPLQTAPQAMPRKKATIPPRRRKPPLIAAGTAGFLFLCLGVWIIIRDRHENIVAQVQVPAGGNAVVKAVPPTLIATKAVSLPPLPTSTSPNPPPTTTTNVDAPTAPPRAKPATTTAPPIQPIGSQPPLAIAPFDAKQARAHQEAWAKYLEVPVEYTDSIGMQFTLIPPGQFTMGNSRSTSDNETSVHRVTISRPFYLGRQEVSQRQFAQIIGTNPSEFHDKNGGTPDHPVETVSWDEADRFCTLLNQSASRPAFGAYGLPSEAQWEYACRAGTTTAFYSGIVVPPPYANIQGREGPHTIPVGSKLPNSFGLYDMHGNVCEFCRDGERDYQDAPVVDPLGPTSVDAMPARRGGSWGFPWQECGSARRKLLTSKQWKDRGHGFRVMLTIERKGDHAAVITPTPTPPAVGVTAVNPPGNSNSTLPSATPIKSEANARFLSKDNWLQAVETAEEARKAALSDEAFPKMSRTYDQPDYTGKSEFSVARQKDALDALFVARTKLILAFLDRDGDSNVRQSELSVLDSNEDGNLSAEELNSAMDGLEAATKASIRGVLFPKYVVIPLEGNETPAEKGTYSAEAFLQSITKLGVAVSRDSPVRTQTPSSSGGASSVAVKPSPTSSAAQPTRGGGNVPASVGKISRCNRRSKEHEGHALRVNSAGDIQDWT